nr:MAG: hypothetical protein [Eriocheir sinensis blumevirus 1]
MLSVEIPTRILVSGHPQVDQTYDGPGLLAGELPDTVASFVGITPSHTIWEDHGAFTQGNHEFVMDGRVKPKKKKTSFWDYSQDVNVPTKYSECTSTKLDGRIHWTTLFKSFAKPSVETDWFTSDGAADNAANAANTYRRIGKRTLDSLFEFRVYAPLQDARISVPTYWYPRFPYTTDSSNDFNYESWSNRRVTPLTNQRLRTSMHSVKEDLYSDSSTIVTSYDWETHGLYTPGLYNIEDSGVVYRLLHRLDLPIDDDRNDSEFFQDIIISVFSSDTEYPSTSGNVHHTYGTMLDFDWFSAIQSSIISSPDPSVTHTSISVATLVNIINEHLALHSEKLFVRGKTETSMCISNPFAEADLIAARRRPDYGKRSSYYRNEPKDFSTGKSVLQFWDRHDVAARYSHDLSYHEANAFNGAMEQYEWSDVEILPFLGEIKSLKDIFPDLFKSLSSLGKLGSGSLATDSKTVAKTASDLYLQYKYAVAPTSGEISAIGKEFLGILGMNHSVREDSIFYQGFKSYMTPQILRSSIKKSTWDTMYNYQIRCTAVLGSPGDKFSDRLLNTLTRAGMFNVLSAKWELTRLSFVYDWFIPVGDALGNIESTLRYMTYPFNVIMYSYSVSDTFQQPIDFMLPEREIFTTPCQLNHYSRYFGGPKVPDVEFDIKFPKKIPEATALLVSNKL